MKFSELWLREWVNPSVDIHKLAEQLTMIGLEVAAVEPVTASFTGVIVGEVIKKNPHPNADRLSLCEVTIGKKVCLPIVCGATNVRQGLKVPVALVGAVLPKNFKIKKTKLRGIESQGMICSESELGLVESSQGIMELPDDAPVGKDLSDYLQLNDRTIEIDLTPNRGDCLSIAGITREVGVINRCKITEPSVKKTKETIEDVFPISIKNKSLCPYYTGRIIRSVNPTANTPYWMKERLRRSGLRSISPIVDVINYVMLELGQPMHAFDLAKLKKGIQVRSAKPEEKITLLDKQRISLDKNTLVIADEQGAQALAGIMGTEASSVTDNTKDIFLESAFFEPANISLTARRYKIYTDSSYRFERGIDPALPIKAIQRATALLLDIVGGKAGPVTEIVADETVHLLKTIHLRRERVARVIGIKINDTDIEDILTRLGFKVKPQPTGWKVTIPSYRFDVSVEVDLIEEVARIYGYDRLPSKNPVAELTVQPDLVKRAELNRIRSCLIDRDYCEAMTYSFVDPKLQMLLDPKQAPKALLNPISADMSVMRTSLWPGLLNALLHNQHRQCSRVRLFETGICFTPQEEKLLIGGIATGTFYPEQWGEDNRLVDFFDMKGDIQNLIDRSHGEFFEFRVSDHPALHPNKSACILYRGSPIGYMGALHPTLEKTLGIRAPVYLFELQLAKIISKKLFKFKEISRFPAIRRDIAIEIDRIIIAEQVESEIKASAGKLLQKVQLFDLYQGKEVSLGKKSLALGLIFQDISRTLVDSEVDKLVQQIVAVLTQKLGAKQRE